MASATAERAEARITREHRLNAVDVLVVGAIAGSFSKTIAAPIDRVRIIYQVDHLKPFTLRAALGTAAQIVQKSGPHALWKGNVATLWRVVPFSGIQFSVWDQAHFRIQAHPAFAEYPTLSSLAAGACAGVTATVATYPLDVLRARQAVGFQYRNYPAAVEEILRKEGPRGLFKGLSPTVIGILPYSAISFSSYEAIKARLRELHGTQADSDVPVAQRLAAGGLCGSLSQLVAYPLHIVRRRMQVQRHMPEVVGASGSLAYANTHQALLHISSNEGVLRGLFKSVSLSWLKGPLTVGVAFVTNDFLKGRLRQHHSMPGGGDQFAPLPGQGHHAFESRPSREVEKGGRKAQATERLVCGGIAGSVAKTVIAPGDRVKILFQTDTVQRFTWRGAWGMAWHIVGEQGVRGLWRGHAATLLRVVPSSATSFAVFEPYKAKLLKMAPGIGQANVNILAGSGAGFTAVVLTYPMDLFRARMAAHRGRESPYDGYLRAIVHTARTEGPYNLYSGLRPTLLGIVPCAGISFGLFETLRARLVPNKKGDARAPLKLLGIGAVSGIIAQSASHPLDTIRRRMQVSPDLYRHEVDALTSIIRNEGIRGLYKGLSMNLVKSPIASGIGFSMNDMLRDFVTRY